MPLEPSDLDELYGVPLAEFVRARKALASRLRQAERPYDAAVVEELKKPSAAVWAINQAARQDRVAVERLVRTADRLRAIQLGRAEGDPDALQVATKEHREAAKTLVGRAETSLRSAGMSPSRALMERIATTLHAAAVDEKARRQLQPGQLADELPPAGFGALAGAPPLQLPRRMTKAVSGRPRGRKRWRS